MRCPLSPYCKVSDKSRVLTPITLALSRLMCMRASGLLNFRSTSAIWKTGFSYTFSMNFGRTFSSFSRLVACNTYCIGMRERRPPNDDCCCTKARALVFFCTAADSFSATSIWL